MADSHDNIKMLEEMTRFEAEIATQSQPRMTGGFAFSQTLPSFIPHQLRTKTQSSFAPQPYPPGVFVPPTTLASHMAASDVEFYQHLAVPSVGPLPPPTLAATSKLSSLMPNLPGTVGSSFIAPPPPPPPPPPPGVPGLSTSLLPPPPPPPPPGVAGMSLVSQQAFGLFNQSQLTLPSTNQPPPPSQMHKTVVMPDISLNGIKSNHTSGPTVSLASAKRSSVISAPPQMAHPRDLAERAREAEEQRDRWATNEVVASGADDDDDVIRALLAAEAGVTYTHVKTSNGKATKLAQIAKPNRVSKNIDKKSGVSGGVTLAAGAVDITDMGLDMSSAASVATATTCTASTSAGLATTLHPVSAAAATAPPPPPPPTMSMTPQDAANAEELVAKSRGNSSAREAAYEDQFRKKKKYLRVAAGAVWEDPTLNDWNPNDFRLFCGDLGHEVTDEGLRRVFSRYDSFQKARVVRDKRSGKSRGYGFVSFSDPADFTRAIREVNGKYVGNRPIKLKKSDWRTRQLETHRRREKEKKKLGMRL